MPSEVHSNFLDAVAEKDIGDAIDSLAHNQQSICAEYDKLLAHNLSWQPREVGRWLEIQLIEAAAVGMIRTVKIGEDVWFAFLSPNIVMSSITSISKLRVCRDGGDRCVFLCEHRKSEDRQSYCLGATGNHQ